MMLYITLFGTTLVKDPYALNQMVGFKTFRKITSLLGESLPQSVLLMYIWLFTEIGGSWEVALSLGISVLNIIFNYYYLRKACKIRGL
eukprot:UN30574